MVSYLFFLCTLIISSASANLTIGFYQLSCPAAEGIIIKTVSEMVASNPGLAAGLIKLHYSDCFVKGCDASVLLLEGTTSPGPERDHPSNRGLRGFEIIDRAKVELEIICPGVVSCADILAFAARDGYNLLGGAAYSVPAGRRDGFVSHEVDLPLSVFNVEQLVQSFASKGMSMEEMVTLSGAHSVGHAHCYSFSDRLYEFNSTHRQDPALDPSYAELLKTRCPFGQGEISVDLDPTPTLMDGVYYYELRSHRGLLGSDQALMDTPSTQAMVMENADDPAAWALKFAEAMVHLGSLEVLTGDQGEIRTTCSSSKRGSVFRRNPDDSSGLRSTEHGLLIVLLMGLGPLLL